MEAIRIGLSSALGAVLLAGWAGAAEPAKTPASPSAPVPAATPAAPAAPATPAGKTDGKEPAKADAKEPAKADIKEPAKVDAPAPETPAPKREVRLRDAAEVAADIDADVDARLAAANVTPSAPSDDAEFLRRAYLDIAGRIPSAAKAAAFLDDRSPDKRAKLVDELLASPDFGRHLADEWYRVMIPRDDNTKRFNPVALRDWLAERFNRNQPWDEMVRDLITAEGDTDKNPATLFLLSHADNGRPVPNKAAGAVGSLFLGVRIQCAECHNHPFTKWRQQEFWGLAAFLARTGVEGNPRQAAKDGGTVSLYDAPVTGVAPGITRADGKPLPQPRGKKNGSNLARPGGMIEIPESKGKVVKARFLEGEEPALKDGELLRTRLAGWVTAPENKFFAHSAVNRFWAVMFGRGLVNPVDDFHPGNPCSHPGVLRVLTAELVASGYDLKHLIRCIALSKTYQRTSRPTPENETDTTLYSRMPVKSLTPEQLFDSLASAMGVEGELAAQAEKAKAQNGGKGGGGARDQFARFFSNDEDTPSPLDYSQGIPQVLRLMNSPQFNRGGPALKQMLSDRPSPAAAVERMFLGTLSRRPTEAETKRFTAFIEKRLAANPAVASALADNSPKGKNRAGNAMAAAAVDVYGGMLWVLVNGSEFALNH
jgi:hypothetical protein